MPDGHCSIKHITLSPPLLIFLLIEKDLTVALQKVKTHFPSLKDSGVLQDHLIYEFSSSLILLEAQRSQGSDYLF